MFCSGKVVLPLQIRWNCLRSALLTLYLRWKSFPSGRIQSPFHFLVSFSFMVYFLPPYGSSHVQLWSHSIICTDAVVDGSAESRSGGECLQCQKYYTSQSCDLKQTNKDFKLYSIRWGSIIVQNSKQPPTFPK